MEFLRRLLGGGPRGEEAVGGDAEVIAQLRAAGANLADARPVDFFLYFPTESVAQDARERIDRSARQVTVEPAASGPAWLVQVVETMIVDVDAMRTRRQEFDGLARELGGEYDGWGAPA
jgi:hypothetical protein